MKSYKIFGHFLLITVISLLSPSCVYMNKEMSHVNRAENYYKRHQFQRAKQEYGTLLNKFPGTSYADLAYVRLGEVFLELGDLNTARTNFQTVLKRFPRSPYSISSRYFLGYIFQEESKFDDALLAYYELVYRLPTKPAIADPLLQTLKQTDTNLPYLFSAKRDVAVRWAYKSLYQMGECYFSKDAYANSLIIYEFLALQRVPYFESHEIDLKLGISKFYMKRFSEAQRLLQSALRKSPSKEEQKESYRFLGATEFALGDRVTGISHMLKYIELESDPAKNEQAREEIIQFIEYQLNKDELLQISANYPHKFPGDHAHLRLIQMEAESGNTESALKDLNLFIANLHDSSLRTKSTHLKDSIQSLSIIQERKIACIGPFSGSLASFGRTVYQGVELAVTLHNIQNPQIKIELVKANTDGNPALIPQIYHDLLTRERVSAIVGPVLSKEVVEAAKYAQKYHIPTITPTATRKNLPDLSEYLFRNCLTYTMQVETLLEFVINKLFLRNFAILYPDNTYGKTLAEEFARLAPTANANIWQKISYNEHQTDFQEILSRLDTENLQAIFIPDFAERIAVIAPQIPFFGIQQFRLLGSDSWNSDTLIKLGGIYVENSFFVDGFFINSPESHVKKFVESYRNYYLDDPDRLAAQAYDAAQVMIKAIIQQGSSRERIRDALLSIKMFPGVTGNFSFKSNGDSQKKGIILSVSEGTIIQVN